MSCQHCNFVSVVLKKIMPAGIKKENLPQKNCEVCHRPFSWRKKWAKCWDDVKYCSDACRKNKKLAALQN
jgi:hypothetical protein